MPTALRRSDGDGVGDGDATTYGLWTALGSVGWFGCAQGKQARSGSVLMHRSAGHSISGSQDLRSLPYPFPTVSCLFRARLSTPSAIRPRSDLHAD